MAADNFAPYWPVPWAAMLLTSFSRKIPVSEIGGSTQRNSRILFVIWMLNIELSFCFNTDDRYAILDE